MIETISIKEFLRTGNFGEFKEIHFGMKREKLIELLGDTEWKHFAGKKSKTPSIYKYGKVEFYFEEGRNGRLHGIQIQLSPSDASLMNLKINYDFIESDLDFDSALRLLDLSSIKYNKLDFEFDGDEIYRIETEGGIQMIFSDNYFNEPISLLKVSKFITLNSTRRIEKQISVSIPKSDFLKLEKMADAELKSVSNICKEIIIEKLNEK